MVERPESNSIITETKQAIDATKAYQATEATEGDTGHMHGELVPKKVKRLLLKRRRYSLWDFV